jgi:hypothetical protein
MASDDARDKKSSSWRRVGVGVSRSVILNSNSIVHEAHEF